MKMPQYYSALCGTHASVQVASESPSELWSCHWEYSCFLLLLPLILKGLRERPMSYSCILHRGTTWSFEILGIASLKSINLTIIERLLYLV